ncbi:MAG: radical SAM protein [Candidatus Altiarchaeota archaeon]
MEKVNVVDKLTAFEKKSWAMKPYAAHRWGADMPCPLRFVVNTYNGCDFKCRYCYVWHKRKTNLKQGFRKAFRNDIQSARKLGLDFHVIISSSTDPLQPMEKNHGETRYALEELLNSGFSVLVMTKNPRMLLTNQYLPLTKDPLLFIDVTIASPDEENPESIFYSAAPSTLEKLGAIKKLTKLGKKVRVKVEPVIPSINGIRGQSEEDLWSLAKLLKDAGVSKVISKTLRLNEDMPPLLYNKLINYYRKNGSKEGINHVLSKKIRKKLLTPLFEACKYYEIPFCPCVEKDLFPKDKTINCLLEGEQAPPIMEVVKQVPSNWTYQS